MARQISTLVDIQFGQTYEPEKARRLVEELRRIAVALNSVVKELNAIDTTSASVVPHVLATTAGLGPEHTVSGLTSGQVLKALTNVTAAFGSLSFAELSGVDASTFLSPINGAYLRFVDGFYTMQAASLATGAPLNAAYILGSIDISLPNSRVVDDSDTITFDTGTSGVLRANVIPGSITVVSLDRVYARDFMFMGA